LRELGYRIDSANDRLPAIIHGTGPRHAATCSVSVEESSQFASALLLSERIGGWKVTVTGSNGEELPYVDMTRRLVNDFPWGGGVYNVEPDASGASYFWGAHWLLRESGSRITVMPAPARALSVRCESERPQGIPPGLQIRFGCLRRYNGGRTMAKGYSNDLRLRVVAIVEAGESAREAARLLNLGASTAIRWIARWTTTGSVNAKRGTGHSRSPLERHKQWLLDLVAAEPDLTLEEIRMRLRKEKKQKAGIGSIWRFYDRHNITFKKNAARRRAGSS
jgi:transposase